MCGFSRTTWILVLAVGAALWLQYFKKGKLCSNTTDLTGKTVIVTGANIGIGYESALALAQRNARVIIACRNEEKAQNAVRNIKQSSGNAAVEYLLVDFAEMADIKRAAEEFMQKEDRLDILINNAGVVTGGKTKDGFDAMFGINHIGYFMFTNLLMPLLRKTAKKSPVRIINVSSDAYMAGKIDFNDLNPEVDVHGGTGDFIWQYSNTKLMNVYFTSELDARLKKQFKGQPQQITTYSLHPGTVRSNLGKSLVDIRGTPYKILRETFLSLFALPGVYGAQTTLCCATEEGIEVYSGNYFSNLDPVELAENARDPEIGRKLWEVSEQLTGVYWNN